MKITENVQAALNKISYGLYLVTAKDENKDNGLIVNTVCQVSNDPTMLTVAVFKGNYSHDLIKKTGELNVCCLSTDAPFSVFERFGFHSGKDTDKFAGVEVKRTENGLAYLTENINSVLSLKVESYMDCDSHGLFICSLTEAIKIADTPSMTYAYYHENVKPKPKAEESKGYVCKICGYVYEGEPLPEDFICPWCKHPASDFEKL